MNWRVIPLLLIGIAAPAVSQIGLPPVGQTLGSLTDRLDKTADALTGFNARRVIGSTTELARDRVNRLTDFVRSHRDRVEMDDHEDPARKGVVLLLDADGVTLDRARQLGFAAETEQQFGNLGLSATVLKIPAGMDLRKALTTLRAALPGKIITADQLHFRSGATGATGAGPGGAAKAAIATQVGIIDGGVAPAISTVDARSFAAGGGRPSDHGTAVASLLRYAGVRNIVSADVYGDDPAGGNALAIVQALDWMAGKKVPIISISLVGPRNPLLERAVAATRKRGIVMLAAVGNDGPLAPPSFPASYREVVAVTGVDGRNRALIEAGRALHLDYAAPGADIRALDRRGKKRDVRGTSFAVPLAAARIAAALSRGTKPDSLRATIDAEAQDLGKKGPDKLFGRGLLCGDCRPR